MLQVPEVFATRDALERHGASRYPNHTGYRMIHCREGCELWSNDPSKIVGYPEKKRHQGYPGPVPVQLSQVHEMFWI